MNVEFSVKNFESRIMNFQFHPPVVESRSFGIETTATYFLVVEPAETTANNPPVVELVETTANLRLTTT